MVFEQPNFAGKVFVSQKNFMTFLFERNVIIIGHAVEAVHAETFVQQQPRQVKSDEPGRSGDQNSTVGIDHQIGPFLFHGQSRPGVSFSAKSFRTGVAAFSRPERPGPGQSGKKPVWHQP